MPLAEYRRKRNFTVTSEPARDARGRRGSKRRFVVQQHAASRMHFDFRLELGRVLVSWAVPKGIPLVHGEKRLAVRVEDHPLSYFDFEGTIPVGEYGGGTVMVWDTGVFEPLSPHPKKALAGGKLRLRLDGRKLQGEWSLVRLKQDDQWLLIRGGGDHPRIPKNRLNASVLTGRTMTEIAREAAVKPGDRPAGHAGSPTNLRARLKARRGSALPARSEIKFIEPMKARLAARPPDGDWQYELKFDGYRALAIKRGDTVALVSRNNRTMTDRFPGVAAAIRDLDVREAVIDGEIVALDAHGRSSFQLLQAYELGETRPPLYYYAFDLLKLNGKTLVSQPIEKRRARLEPLVPKSKRSAIRFSSSLGGDAPALLDRVRSHRLEGLIGKRAGSIYEPGRRSGAWVKLKTSMEQEFVVGGFTEPAGTRSHFGALLVGYFNSGLLRYAGKVGTGFDERALAHLSGQFRNLGRARCPFADLPESGRHGQGISASAIGRCHWLKPVLVAQIKFAEWTRDGRLRQPVFLGLRPDKPASDVVREVPG